MLKNILYFHYQQYQVIYTINHWKRTEIYCRKFSKKKSKTGLWQPCTGKPSPNVEKHFVLLSYAISSQSHQPNSIKWPKILIFIIFGLKLALNGPNLGPKILLSTPWLRLVATYRCQLSQYAKSGQPNQPNSIKLPKTSISRFLRNFLSLGGASP